MSLAKRFRQSLTFIIFLSFSTAGCGHEPTAEECQKIASLNEELAVIRQQLQDANQQNEAYSGGLIKSLIAVRLEILKTNEGLVQQRILALETGAQFNIVLNAAKPDAIRAAELAKEIEAQEARLVEAQGKSDRYRGGLDLTPSNRSNSNVRVGPGIGRSGWSRGSIRSNRLSASFERPKWNLPRVAA